MEDLQSDVSGDYGKALFILAEVGRLNVGISGGTCSSSVRPSVMSDLSPLIWLDCLRIHRESNIHVI